MNYDVIIVGAGYAGTTAARILAEKGNHVLILEKRSHIGGNAYDYIDENHVRRHEYGPHLFHTNSEKAVTFLSRFTEWYPYEHRVLGYIQGKLVPIPFNLTSIEKIFEKEKADHLKQVLIDTYGMEKKVPILELRKNEDPTIKELAEFIFENVFKYYTMKQWGYTVEEIDPAVTGRVPVHISYDDRYFQDRFQKMPAEGFTPIFEKMLDHENIEVRLNVNAMDLIRVDADNNRIFFEDKPYTGKLVYTGIVDELFGYCLGELPYRSLHFDIQTHTGVFQPVCTVNYPTPEEVHPYTRITEYRHMMASCDSDTTTIAVEYPYAYDKDAEKGNIPYYPVFTGDSEAAYQAYVKLAEKVDNLYLLGRLAEYRYYNMDAIVERAITFAEEL